MPGPPGALVIGELRLVFHDFLKLTWRRRG